eukprot:gene6354-9280_t
MNDMGNLETNDFTSETENLGTSHHESLTGLAGFFDRDSRRQRALQEKRYRARREKYEEEKQRMLSRTGYDTSLGTIKTGPLKISNKEITAAVFHNRATTSSVRNQLRSWVKFHCELRHGMLIMYKEDKHDAWMDTILLSGGLVIERPSRKEGFTFKFSHPLKQSIHAPRGPRGELWINLLRMPSDHCIFRVATAEECDEWILAFKQAIYGPHPRFNELMTAALQAEDDDDITQRSPVSLNQSRNIDASLVEDQPVFEPFCDGYENGAEHVAQLRSQLRAAGAQYAELDETDMNDSCDLVPSTYVDKNAVYSNPSLPAPVTETSWLPSHPFVANGNAIGPPETSFSSNTLEKFWEIASQLQVGDVIDVPIEMRQSQSEIQRISDLFLHADFLSDACKYSMPRARFACVVRWAVSTLQLMPESISFPLPPLRGEVFRCMFECPNHGTTPSTRAFFIAETVDPTSRKFAFEISNRRAGWRVSGVLTPNTLFFGNTIHHSYIGHLTVKLYHHAEEYYILLPKQATRGKLLCKNVPYASLSGSWDADIALTADDVTEVLLGCKSPELHQRRLHKFVVTKADLWQPSSSSDEVADTQTKWTAVVNSLLRQDYPSAQSAYNQIVRASQEKTAQYYSKFFAPQDDTWIYTGGIDRPWDNLQDVYEYQHVGELKVLTIDDACVQITSATGLVPRTLSPVKESKVNLHEVGIATTLSDNLKSHLCQNGYGCEKNTVSPDTIASLHDRLLTVERIIARERLIYFTAIIIVLVAWIFGIRSF